MSPFLRSHPRALLAATAIAVAVPAGALSAGLAGASSSSGSLEGAIAAAQAHAGELSAGIGADSRQIAGYQGGIDDLQTQLGALESSLAFERNQLARLKAELAAARTQLAALQVQLTHDRRVLVAQVVASYEEPPPSIATVVLESHGFADLIERVDDLRAIAGENAQATVRVAAEGQAVTLQAARLAELQARAQRNASAVKVQRDEVAQLHLALVTDQLHYIGARNQKSAALSALRSHAQSLEHELAAIQTRELAAAGVYSGPVGTLTVVPEGEYGFFQAPGTNYSVGVEPQLVARLNTLGKALRLHLIGISGYRTPAHSVEVGGFANDPHTRGEASDTPGVEGVPEATLERVGLTRPFPGAAEADHIQLLGSAR